MLVFRAPQINFGRLLPVRSVFRPEEKAFSHFLMIFQMENVLGDDNLHLHIFILCSNIESLFGGNYVLPSHARRSTDAGVPCEKGR
jgi:hypothetical protein